MYKGANSIKKAEIMSSLWANEAVNNPSFFDNESINESDLGLTYKRGKTIKVTHKKSGKELIIIDKPNVKREYEKIGYFAEGQVNERFRPSDRKVLMVVVRDTINKLRKKNPDIDRPDRQLGQALNAILRAMTREKSDRNYRQYKKYFPKYNDKLLRRLASAYFDEPYNVQNTFMRDAMKYSFKESVNEGVSKSQAQEIMNQLGGRKFEMLMGVKSKGIGKDGLILHIGKNPKRVSHIIIDLDRGRDLYNLTFGKIYKYQFKVIKKLKGIYVDQLHDMIEKYTGNLTTFRPRR